MQPVGDLFRRWCFVLRQEQRQCAVFGDIMQNAGRTQLAPERRCCVPRCQARYVLGKRGVSAIAEMETEGTIEAGIEMSSAAILAQHVAQTLHDLPGEIQGSTASAQPFLDERMHHAIQPHRSNEQTCAIEEKAVGECWCIGWQMRAAALQTTEIFALLYAGTQREACEAAELR